MIDLRIDGDVINYRAGFASDSRNGELSHALHNVKVILRSIQERYPNNVMTIYLSSRDSSLNFRTQIVTDYKANRKKKCRVCSKMELTELPGYKLKGEFKYRAFQCDSCGFDEIQDTKPYYYVEIRKYLIQKFGAKVCKWGEADDWLGTNATENTVIASIDKDLLMIPCTHYRLHKDEEVVARDPGELFLIPKVDKKGRTSYDLKGYGMIWFMAQMLTGDSVDNIHKPQRGMGPIQIYNLLDGLTDVHKMWDTVAQVYRDNGISDEDILINGQLLWIARKPREIFHLGLLDEYG